MAVAYCPNCGAARLPDARFCGSCGSDLEALVQQAKPAPSPAPAVAPPAPPATPPVVTPTSRPQVGVAAADRARPATRRRGVHPLAAFGLALAMLVLAGGSAWLVARPRSGPTDVITPASPLASAPILTSPKASSVGSLLKPLRPAPTGLVDPTNPRALGLTSAPVTVEVWSDFQCPACDAFATTIEQDLIDQYVATGKVRLVYRDYAFIDKGAADGESQQAAAAARCAGNKFWPFHDYLFENQRGENKGTFSAALLASVADAVGADRTVYDACMANGAADTVAAVRAETAVGVAAGVNATPTIALNGTLMQGGAQPMTTLGPAIDALIGAAPAASATSARPRRLSAQVTDDVAAVGGTTSAVHEALDDLQQTDNVQLWVWFTNTTGALSAPDFATQTATLSGLGGNDLVLVIAMNDHAYGYWKSSSIPLTDAQLETVLGTDLEPALRAGDNAGAIIATASGIHGAMSGTVGLDQTSPNATEMETLIRTYYNDRGFAGQYQMAAVDGLHAHTTATGLVLVVCTSYAYRGLNGNADGHDVKSFSLLRSGTSWIVTSFSGLSDYPSLAACDQNVGGSLLP